LHPDGLNTRPAPERKRLLAIRLERCWHHSARLLYSEHFESGAELYERVSAMKLECVASKRADAP